MKPSQKRSPGRPRFGPALKLFNVNLPEEEVRELDALLQARGLTRSELLRDLIRAYLRRERRRSSTAGSEVAA